MHCEGQLPLADNADISLNASRSYLPAKRGPVPTPIIERPHLNERFRAGLHLKLTIVETPAGYGKTTLLRSWERDAAARGHRTRWVSLDAANETALECLERYTSFYGRNDAAISERSELKAVDCLYIDDLHEAGKPEKELFQRLIASSRNLHVIVGTRDTRDIPLARMRLSGEVSDFGVEDLKFTLQEAIELLGDLADPDLIGRYFEYSEGWAAALRMMRRSLEAMPEGGRAFIEQSTGRPALAEYLNEQFLAGLSDDERALLIDLAQLREFNGDLADSVRRTSGSWTLLESLASAHSLVFEQAREDGTWFRCHQLMRDFLIWRQRSLGEARVSDLNRRAALWFASHKRIQAAVQHAMQAGDAALAERILLGAGGVQIGIREGSLRLKALLEIIPNSKIYSSPRLSLAKGYLHLKNGRHHDAAILIEDVRANADTTDIELGREIILLEAHLWLYRDQHLTDEQVDSLEHTAASTPASDLLTRGILYNFLCLFHHQVGRLDQARRCAEMAMDLYTDLGTLHLQFFMHLNLSLIDLDQGKFEDAKARRETASRLQREHYGHDLGIQAIADIFHAEIAFEAGETEALGPTLIQALGFADTREGWSEVYLAGYETAFALILRDAGYEQAIDILANAEAMISRRDLPRFSRQIRILELDLAVSAAKETEAKRLAARVRHLLKAADGNESLRWRGRHLAILALSHFETRFGNALLAHDMLTALAAECRNAGLYRYLARVSALLTINAAVRKDKDAAARALDLTIRLSRDGQFPGAHLRAGREFAEAARWAIRERGVSTLNKSALSALAHILWLLNPDRRDNADFFSDILTSKEREVFTLLADGRANKVIARDLELSEATVKFHAKNIYQKLGVNSRKLVAEIARQHGVTTPDSAGQAG